MERAQRQPGQAKRIARLEAQPRSFGPLQLEHASLDDDQHFAPLARIVATH
jgi:hypothetical protein